MTMDLFYSAPCLSDDLASISAEDIRKKWFSKSDKRYLSQALYKFITYNQDCFDFLEISTKVHGVDKQTALTFSTSKYIGAIPLRAPDTGKQIGDFWVHPRAIGNKDKYSTILKLIIMLEETVNPEHFDSIPLASGMSVSPPLYYDAILYIDSFEKITSSKWHKFQTVKGAHEYPKSNTDWNAYFLKEHDPNMRITFPCRDNKLSINHSDFENLKYVFELAKKELTQPTTPYSIRYKINSRLEIITKKVELIASRPCRTLCLRAADPIYVKKAKQQANILLSNNWTTSYAWRIDISVLFERFVQFVLKKAALEIGASVIENTRFHVRGKRPEWGLYHLEPDVVLVKGARCVFADAKYKMHFYNLNASSDKLKESYRMDLHQLLAYCSFDSYSDKVGLLFYPSSDFVKKTTRYTNGVNFVENTVVHIGIPFDSDRIDDVNAHVKEMLIDLLLH